MSSFRRRLMMAAKGTPTGDLILRCTKVVSRVYISGTTYENQSFIGFIVSTGTEQAEITFGNVTYTVPPGTTNVRYIFGKWLDIDDGTPETGNVYFKGNFTRIRCNFIYNKAKNDDGYYTNQVDEVIYWSPNLLLDTTYMFAHQRRLTGTIVIPEGITNIGSETFLEAGADVAAGVTIILPQNINSIGYEALLDARLSEHTSLMNLLPPSLITIDDSAFRIHRESLMIVPEEFDMPNNIETIGDEAFGAYFWRSVKKVLLPQNIKTIGSEFGTDYWFMLNNDNGNILEEVVFRGTQLTDIGYAFCRYCVNLPEVILPSGLITIGSYSGRTLENAGKAIGGMSKIDIPASCTGNLDYFHNQEPALQIDASNMNRLDIYLRMETMPEVNSAFLDGCQARDTDDFDHVFIWVPTVEMQAAWKNYFQTSKPKIAARFFVGS